MTSKRGWRTDGVFRKKIAVGKIVESTNQIEADAGVGEEDSKNLRHA
jgi:hypothetical protein